MGALHCGTQDVVTTTGGTRDMKPWSLAAIGIVSLMSFGCTTAPTSNAPTSVNMAGEWTGVATKGPTFPCHECFGRPGPVHLVLAQNGGTLTGTLVGENYRGTISATVTEKGMYGSCTCTLRGVVSWSVSIDASIAGNDMVFSLSDATMTLSRTR